ALVGRQKRDSLLLKRVKGERVVLLELLNKRDRIVVQLRQDVSRLHRARVSIRCHLGFPSGIIASHPAPRRTPAFPLRFRITVGSRPARSSRPIRASTWPLIRSSSFSWHIVLISNQRAIAG